MTYSYFTALTSLNAAFALLSGALCLAHGRAQKNDLTWLIGLSFLTSAVAAGFGLLLAGLYFPGGENLKSFLNVSVSIIWLFPSLTLAIGTAFLLRGRNDEEENSSSGLLIWVFGRAYDSFGRCSFSSFNNSWYSQHDRYIISELFSDSARDCGDNSFRRCFGLREAWRLFFLLHSSYDSDAWFYALLFLYRLAIRI